VDIHLGIKKSEIQTYSQFKKKLQKLPKNYGHKTEILVVCRFKKVVALI
jgi:hypothetical protein